ncbi:kelch-like protein 32 isoform X3 [Indicator indicator]|uniref:kelch-like protein 32 isoform X3 n=1 Tax=Indicator indicator TaxID=1002788 RepID=UPI0023DFDBD3|nr:kelch-like protein 32 isoform X3 [Indicator indicator]
MPSERCLSVHEMLTGQRLCQSSSHNDAVLAALNQQRSDGTLCDVTLIAEEQKFHAHKAVLAACSDYFRILLEPGVIQDVLAAGSHLQLLELLSLCSHYLIQELNSFNYLDLYKLADLFNLTLLENAVVDFLVKHLSELLKSHPEKVLSLPYCVLREVFKSDRLTSLSEEQIWQLAVRWLEHNCCYQYLEELLQDIRFGLMDADTLHAVALTHPLVQASEAAMALVREALAYHQSTFAQPLWQSRRTRLRSQSDTLYIVGGKKQEVCKVRELRYFNPADQENAHVAGVANWSEMAPMPVARSHHCVAIMGHFLFVAGGEAEQCSRRSCAVRTACRYDPRHNRWADIAPMKNCREHFVLGALGDFLYAVGGRNELRQVLPTVERYCPRKNKWSFVQPFDRSLSCHAGYVLDGLLWVSGGVTNTAQYQNRLMVYDPKQNKWLSRSPMLQRRVYHSMAAVQRKLYVLGGNDLDYNNDRVLVRHIDAYSIDTDQWTRCRFSILTGQNESGVAVHNSRIYLVGGYSIWTNEPLACIQVLDVSKEGKEEVFYGPALPFASNGIAACFLPAPHFSCPDLQTLQVPHHRLGAL